MPIRLNKLTSVQFESLSRKETVFFFPLGPLEDHGPHLPLGLDLEEAYQLCALSALELERQMPGWTGVIMPSVPLGIDTETTRIAITVRPHVLRDWLVDSCRSLIRNGFSHFVCFSGNLGPKQLTAIEEAGKIVRRIGIFQRGLGPWIHPGSNRPELISASSALVSWKDILASPFWLDPIEHGGERDTSVALAISEDLVDSNFRHLPLIERHRSRWHRNLERRFRRRSGYWGNPATSDRAQGERELSRILEKVFPKMRAVWEGANPASLFRSWYSILPPNKSFFNSWLLVILICLFIAGYLYLTSMLNQFE